MFDTLRQRDFGLPWLASLVSIAVDLARIVALPLHGYQLTGATCAIATTLSVGFLPGMLIGSVAGIFVGGGTEGCAVGEMVDGVAGSVVDLSDWRRDIAPPLPQLPI